MNITKSQFETGAKVALGGGVVLAVGAVALLLLQSLLAIAACGVVGLVMYHGAPVFARKMSTWKFLALQADARENPIPNLIRSLELERKNFNGKKASVVAFSATTKNFKSKLEHFRAKGAQGVVEMEAMYANMKRACAYQILKLEAAQEALIENAQMVSAAQDTWQISCEIIAANEAMGVFSQVDPVEDMLKKISYDAVTSKLSNSMAQLEVSLALDYKALPDDIKQLEVQSSDDLNQRLKQLEAV